MTSTDDPYVVLGVLPTSDDVVIRGAYKALMLKYHPDTNPSSEAIDRATAINAAYAIIGNAERRAAYDLQRREAAPRTSLHAEDFQTSVAMVRRRIRSWPVTSAMLLVATGAVVAFGVAVVNPHRSATMQSTPSARMPQSANSRDARRQAVGDDEGSGPMVEVFGKASEPAPPEATPASPEPTAASSASASSDAMIRNSPPPPIDSRSVANAVATLERILADDGMDIARLESLSCVEAVAAKPEWERADRCAAFDQAARLVDRQSGPGAMDPYFATRESEAVYLYAASGMDAYLVRQRLERIYAMTSSRLHRKAVHNDAAPTTSKGMMSANPFMDAGPSRIR